MGLGRTRCRRRTAEPIAPLDGPTSRTHGPQRKFGTPSTSAALTAPPKWSSAAGREYRRPCAGVQLTLCSWPVGADTSACCPRTIHTIPRRLGIRYAACLVTQHATADSIVDGRVTLLASQAQGSTSSLSCCCPRRWAASAYHLWSLHGFGNNDRAQFWLLQGPDSGRAPLHTAALLLRVASSVAACARVRQIYCCFRGVRPPRAPCQA